MIGRRVGARRSLALIVGLAALTGSAYAQVSSPHTASPTASPAAGSVDPERLALAREYIRKSQIEAAMRGMFTNLARNMPQPSDQATDVKGRQLLNSFSTGMDAALPQLMEATAEATARTFTTQELKDLVAFYGSPTGQSMVAKMPTLMQQLVPKAFQIMPTVYATAEADYCRHVTCTQADHDRFQRMRSALPQGPPAPRGSE